MVSLVIDVSDGLPFTFGGPSTYRVDPWDVENNPSLMLWAKAHNDPLGLVKETMDDAADQHLKDEVGFLLKTEFKTKSIYLIVLRNVGISRYGFAVPDKKALDLIKRHSPNGVVEIGAGSGYWAMLLKRLGVPVSAYDRKTGRYRSQFKFGGYFPVEKSNHKKALAGGAHREKTLLLVWPDYCAPWSSEALSLYKGDTVAYVGEGDGGCTGDDKFHEILSTQWNQVDDYSIPVWWGIHDRLYIYKRK